MAQIKVFVNVIDIEQEIFELCATVESHFVPRIGEMYNLGLLGESRVIGVDHQNKEQSRHELETCVYLETVSGLGNKYHSHESDKAIDDLRQLGFETF